MKSRRIYLNKSVSIYFLCVECSLFLLAFILPGFFLFVFFLSLFRYKGKKKPLCCKNTKQSLQFFKIKEIITLGLHGPRIGKKVKHIGNIMARVKEISYLCPTSEVCYFSCVL